MHPLLLDLGAWQVTSYGLALTLAFSLGIGLGLVRARQHGLAAEPVLGVSIVIILSSILGSRLFQALNAGDPSLLDALNPFSSRRGVYGLSVMGGLPAALLCSWLYLRLRALPVLAYMDLLSPSVAFGAGVTRIGCFMNGCCYGVACDWPWAVRFPPGSFAQRALGDVAVHPTQLYQSLLGFAIGFALLALARRKPPAGSVLSVLICTWGLQRSAVELVRYHADTEIWLRVGSQAVSIYQAVAVGLILVGGAGWLWCAKKRPAGV